MTDTAPSATSTEAPVPENTLLPKQIRARRAKRMGVGLKGPLPPGFPPLTAPLCALSHSASPCSGRCCSLPSPASPRCPPRLLLAAPGAPRRGFPLDLFHEAALLLRIRQQGRLERLLLARPVGELAQSLLRR